MPKSIDYDSDDEPEKLIVDALPEALDYNSDDGPEEFVEDAEALDYNSEDEPETISEEVLKDYDHVIELQIECLENEANESTAFDPAEISLEFLNDLANEMQIKPRTPTLAEDGLGNVNKFFKVN